MLRTTTQLVARIAAANGFKPRYFAKDVHLQTMPALSEHSSRELCLRGNSCLGDSVEHFNLVQELAKNPYFSYRGEKSLRIWRINGIVTDLGVGTLAIFFLLGMILLYFLSQSTFDTVLEIIRKLVQAALGA